MKSFRRFTLALGVSAALVAAAIPVRAGSVVCAGNGPLGDGTTSDSNIPVRVSNISNVVSVGLLPMMAVKSDGTVWTWGDGASGPAQIPGLDSVVAVTGSELGYKLALKADGTVWHWGKEPPVPVADPADATGFLTHVTAIASGSRSYYALKSDGTVWAWGENYHNDSVNGLLGDGTTIDSPIPVQCLNLSNIKAITADRSHAMALKSDGTVWAWGSNQYGQFGDGSNTSQLAPVPVFPPGGALSTGAGAVAIAASAYTSYLVRADGTVWGCGENSNGQVGDGTTDSRNTWVRVGDLTGVVSIASGANAWIAIVVKSDGSAWSWGLFDHGHLGCGTNGDALLPCRVRGAASEATNFLGGVIAAASNATRSCFLTTQEPVYVPSIAMAANTGKNKATVAATVTVLDEFDAPVAGAVVNGHWSTQTTCQNHGITGPDGTVTFTSSAFQRPNETCTFVLDSVTKTDTFLDRSGSVLSNSIVVTR